MRKGIDSSTIWLAVLITSYFICIPLGRFSFGAFASDFRLYDYTAILFLFFNWQKIYKISGFINSKSIFFTYYSKWLIIIVLISIISTVAFRGLGYLPPVIIRAARYVLYFSSASIAIAIVSNLQRFKFIVWVFFINITVQAIIAFAQGLGFLPGFWPKYWLVAYAEENNPVGTLSPHHKHIGVIMLLGISMALGMLNIYKGLIIRIIFIGLILIMSAVPLFSATKTFLFSMIGVIIGYFIINRAKAIPFATLAVIGAVIVLNYSQDTAIYSNIEEQLHSRLGRWVEEGNISKITTGRDKVYINVLEGVANNPYLLITGAGFQGISVFTAATGAHNNYLHYLVETGIIGLVVFMFFLYYIHRNLQLSWRFASTRFEQEIIKHIWVAFIGVIFSTFTGEVLYAQYSMFTLPGQILILMGIGVAPLYWKYIYHHANRRYPSIHS